MRPAILLALLAPLLLAACDTPAEKAEAHYDRAMELIEASDPARAEIELRNVLRLVPDHAAAQLQYAALLRAEDPRGALAQYQRLAEQHPERAEAHRGLAMLAYELQDFETARLHAARTLALAPGDPPARAIVAAVDYARDDDRPAALETAAAVIAEDPGAVTARLVLVADRLGAQDAAGALALIDAGLAVDPDSRDLRLARLAALERLGDDAAVGAELARLQALLPEDPQVRTARVGWLLGHGETDAAEAVMRESADAAAPDDPAAGLALARFLLEIRGSEAARAELAARADAAEAAGADPLPFRRAVAGLDFDAGRRDAAIAEMRAIVADAPPSDTSRDNRVALAAMLRDTGAAAESAALVEAVLAEDRRHVAALKLHARAAIEADLPETAIQDMRTALTEAPRDPELQTIMALAHEREGERGLMGERLSLAVELSGRAPAESQRYAAFLMQEDRPGPAEGVIRDALRRAPDDRELLATLGRIHLARRDWDRAGQVAARLRAAGDPAAGAAADAIDAARLQGAGRTDEHLALLESLVDAEADHDAEGDAALAALVRARIAAGETDAARRDLEDRLARDPGDQSARFLLAGVEAAEGDLAAAEALYREIIATAPALAPPYRALFTLLAGTGRPDAAVAALEAGIAAAGDNGPLLFLRAGLREAQGDIAGAVADYRTLYDRDSDSPVLANNLASLMLAGAGPAGDGAPDGATLDRAYAIARRLAGTDVPEFRDTYGWLLHLRGDHAGAFGYLEPAAAALPGNAQVQFHLAEVAAALGRDETARDAAARALAAAAAGSPLPEAAATTARALAADPAGDPAPDDG